MTTKVNISKSQQKISDSDYSMRHSPQERRQYRF